MIPNPSDQPKVDDLSQPDTPDDDTVEMKAVKVNPPAEDIPLYDVWDENGRLISTGGNLL